ncbi:major facilitator superfamily domain-containing protein [Papiliotrema laurentii]|uniref:Major facilitator superfamily domain-containing protein n=1 Tax=Papiliotrema laurentii TaxID=5418 RepID=A0AAD9CVI2_PAPLA|nr:major facilitator superfamily domain-containing protein [Papiliotrema laurentii]
MMKSLQLQVGERYSIVTLLFFVPYIIFELPSNMVLRKVGTRYWLGGIVIAFGILTIGQGFTKHWWQFAICRVLLGVFESGFFPGCVYLLSCWYPRYQTAGRMAVFYLTSMVISGFSNIIGYGMSLLAPRGGLLGWQWIYLLFGIITVVLGIAAVLLIVDFPEKSTFLTPEEKAWAIDRIERDRGDAVPDKMSWGTIKRDIIDWKIWGFAYLFMSATTGSYAFAFFLPVILAGGGYSTETALLLSAPPYVFAAIYTFISAVLSDKTRLRAPFIAFSCLVCIVGLAILAYADKLGVRYFGAFLTIAGAQSNVPAVIAYSQNNILGSSKRSLTSALVIGFGGVGGIIASAAYRQADSPTYIPGLWTTLGLNIGSIILLGILSMYMRAQNRKLSAGGEHLNEGRTDFKYAI